MRAVVIHAPKDLRIDNYPDTERGPGEVRVKDLEVRLMGEGIDKKPLITATMPFETRWRPSSLPATARDQ